MDLSPRGNVTQQPIVSEPQGATNARGDNEGGSTGKDVVIFNSFDALNLLDAYYITRGLNTSSPPTGDPC